MLTQVLHAPTTPWTSVREYQSQVQAQGFDFLRVPEQPLVPGQQLMQIRHKASGECFDLAQVQPDGPTAPSLLAQVREMLRQQQQQREALPQVTSKLEGVLAAENFTNWPEFRAQARQQGCRLVSGLDGSSRWLDETSNCHFAAAELQPNGRGLTSQVNEVIAARRAELVHGRIEVADNSQPAAGRAERIRSALVAAGALVEVLPSPVAEAGSPVVLAYAYRPGGPRLDEVNAVLAVVQPLANTRVREQGVGAEPVDRWPVRNGQYGEATVVVTAGATQGATERVGRVRAALVAAGASVRELPGQQRVLGVRYHTQRIDQTALNSTLEKLKNFSPGIEVRETEPAHQGREPGRSALSESVGIEW